MTPVKKPKAEQGAPPCFDGFSSFEPQAEMVSAANGSVDMLLCKRLRSSTHPA